MTHLTNQDLGRTSHTPRDELYSEIIPLLSWRFGIWGDVLGCVRHIILSLSMILNVTVASNPFTLLSELYYSYLSDPYDIARHYYPTGHYSISVPLKSTEQLNHRVYDQPSAHPIMQGKPLQVV
jgi:hypothetical protein